MIEPMMSHFFGDDKKGDFIKLFEAKKLLDGKMIRLIDVREPEEFAFCHIEGSESVPLLNIPKAILEGKLKAEEQIVVMCHTGRRSGEVVKFLKMRGFGKVKNLEGGIDDWSFIIDPSIPAYDRNPDKTARLISQFWEKAK